jgi:hypothetical protein
MIEHDHCYCFPVCYSESHTGFEIDERGKRKPTRHETNTRDSMCCHCGHFKEGRLVFVQAEGHGVLRHHTRPIRPEEKKQ